MIYYYRINQNYVFFIKPLIYGNFGLFINDNLLGSYISPHAAADDVYHHFTGFDYWDELTYLDDEPYDLSFWEILH